MSLTTTTAAELDARAGAAFTRTVSLLRQTDPGLRLQKSEWTVQDVCAHLLTVLRRYTRRDFTDRAGLADTPAALSRENGRDLRALGAATHADLIDGLEHEFAGYLGLNLPLEGTYPFHADQVIDGAGARSNVMGELLVHGYDVARATATTWPLDERDLVLVLNGVLQVAPGWLDPARASGIDLSAVLAVRGAVPQLFRIVDGCCVIRDAAPSDRPDAVIRGRAQPVALLLYHRIPLWTAVARGVVVTGGRRPWRGLGLPDLFLAA